MTVTRTLHRAELFSATPKQFTHRIDFSAMPNDSATGAVRVLAPSSVTVAAKGTAQNVQYLSWRSTRAGRPPGQSTAAASGGDWRAR